MQINLSEKNRWGHMKRKRRGVVLSVYVGSGHMINRGWRRRTTEKQSANIREFGGIRCGLGTFNRDVSGLPQGIPIRNEPGTVLKVRRRRLMAGIINTTL